MEKATVKRVELLEKLKANRAAHRTLFEEAQVAYREEVITQLDKALIEARAGKRYATNLHIVTPVDQTREYDQAIAMLEMSIEDNIEISQADFRCYVMDAWTWKQDVLRCNTMYIK